MLIDAPESQIQKTLTEKDKPTYDIEMYNSYLVLPNNDDEDLLLAFVTLDFCPALVVVTLDCPRLPRWLFLQPAI